MSRDCKHGHLSRMCPVCELETERDALRARVAEFETQMKEEYLRFDSLKEHTYKLEARIAELEAERGSLLVSLLATEGERDVVRETERRRVYARCAEIARSYGGHPRSDSAALCRLIARAIEADAEKGE